MVIFVMQYFLNGRYVHEDDVDAHKTLGMVNSAVMTFLEQYLNSDQDVTK